jgi:hypothetical protein
VYRRLQWGEQQWYGSRRADNLNARGEQTEHGVFSVGGLEKQFFSTTVTRTATWGEHVRERFRDVFSVYTHKTIGIPVFADFRDLNSLENLGFCGILLEKAREANHAVP